MGTRGHFRVLLGGMTVVGCVVAACVGEDPDSDPRNEVDGGGVDGGGTNPTDSSTTTDTGTTTDSGGDGGLGPPPAATGDVKWTVPTGDAGGDYASAVTFDGNGNVIVCGRVSGTVDFGCAAPIVSDGASVDVAVVKYDATGKCVWAQRMGGASLETVSVCVAGPDGEVYVGGQTYSPMWSIGAGSAMTGAVNSPDLFVVRLKGDGSGPDWAKTWGEDNLSDSITGIAVNPTKKRIAIVGTTAKAAAALSFDSVQMAAPNVAMSGIGFVAELDSTSGMPQWIRGVIRDSADVKSGSSPLSGVAYDAQGNVVVAGTIYNGQSPQDAGAPAWFHDYPDTTKTITLHTSKTHEAILVKYDPANSGKVVWGDNVKMSNGSYNASRGDAIVIDPAANKAFLATTYHNSVSFNGGGLLPGAGLGESVGVLTVDLTNGSVVAGRGWGSSDFEWVNGFARDPWGNLLLCGGTKGTIDFGKGTTTHKAPGQDSWDSYVAKLGPDVEPLWSRQFGAFVDD